MLFLLYAPEITLVCGGGAAAAEISLKGAWTTDAFISRANKRQLTNKPLIESPSLPPSPLSAADLLPFLVMIPDNASNSVVGGGGGGKKFPQRCTFK